MEQNSIRNMKIWYQRKNSDTSTRAHRQNASVVCTLSALCIFRLIKFPFLCIFRLVKFPFLNSVFGFPSQRSFEEGEGGRGQRSRFRLQSQRRTSRGERQMALGRTTNPCYWWGLRNLDNPSIALLGAVMAARCFRFVFLLILFLSAFFLSVWFVFL